MDKFKFDEATQKELATFLETQQAQMRVNGQIQTLTAQCWEKCVPGAIGSSLSRSEQGCLANCVERFLDTSLFLVNVLDQKRKAH